jgi:hypothetical protein
MAQVPLTNSGTITNKGTIKIGCTVGSSLENTAGTIANNATGRIEFTGPNAVLTNTSGTLTNDGTIQFQTANPLFARTAGTVTNTATGKIQFDGAITQDVITGFGTNPTTDRIGGTVIYNGVAGQIVQGQTAYTNLTLSAVGAKTFTNGENYAVSEVYTSDLAGVRNYGTSIFRYDGSTPQVIFPENSTYADYYYDLELEGTGAKSIATGTSVNVSNAFNNLGTATAVLNMADASKLEFDAGIVGFARGNITATGATIKMDGTGTFDIVGGVTVLFAAGTSPLFEMNGGTVTNAGTMTFNAGTYQQNVATSLSTHSGALNLTGGLYNQETGDVVISGTATINNAASVYTQTAGNIDISGLMTVTNGLLAINGATGPNDLVTITNTGTLDLSASTGSIAMAAATGLYVNGSFTSAATTNLGFNPTSTVTYDGGLQILATTDANSFGNLTLLNAAKTHLADIYVDGNFNLSDANLAMGTTNKLVMTDITKTATYEALFEVSGNMARVMTGSTAPLTFNNTATKVTLTTPGNLDLLTLNVTPGDILYDGYVGATDVKRSIELEYGTQANWMITMSYGYTTAELGALNESLLRYREGLTATTSEKVATGEALIPVNASATWGSLTLPGIIPGDNTGTLAEVKTGDPLFLRSAPVTYFTISDGRWSNPGTWDEGKQPASTDNTEVLHTVHVGFQGGADRTDLINGVIDERTNLAGPSFPLAQTILIRDVDGASLVFGDNPSPDNPTYNSTAQDWVMNTGGIITNQNTTANAPANVANLDAADLASFISNTTTGTYQGLIIFDDGTPLTKPISLKTNQLINAANGEVMVGPNTTLQICD